MWIKNARILTFDAANTVLDDGAVGVKEGKFAWVGRASEAPKGAEVVDAKGMLLMPALINAHTHLYSTLARGISLPGKAPRNFPEILKKLWWRLDRALNADDVYYSALVGIIDSAKAGVGTLVDHHSSPNACAGSLDRIAQAFEEVGLRGCLCYETSDRNGLAKAHDGILENKRFINSLQQHPHALLQGAFGLHASFTLGEATLRRAVDAAGGSGFHIHVAEDVCDVRDARHRFGCSPVARLVKAGVLAEKTLAAHCVHVNAADIAALVRHRVNVVHNPQSNCNNAVGTAKVREMTKAGALVGLGSDGYSPRMWEEFKTAVQLQKLPTHEAYALGFLNNRQILKKIWGLELGRIATGALADFILLDYHPPTPMRADNLFGHLLFGIAQAPVEALVVHGKFVVRDRICVNVNEAAVAERARAQARRLWERF